MCTTLCTALSLLLRRVLVVSAKYLLALSVLLLWLFLECTTLIRTYCSSCHLSVVVFYMCVSPFEDHLETIDLSLFLAPRNRLMSDDDNE